VVFLGPNMKEQLAGWTTFASPLLSALASRWWAVVLVLSALLVMMGMTFITGYRLAKLLGTTDTGIQPSSITVKASPLPIVNITWERPTQRRLMKRR
jgi:hypothetical protein